MPVILQAGWPPINATSSFINSTNLSGGKGHSWSRWWDKIRLRRKEMGVKVRLQLAYHSLVNVRKVTDLINHLIEDNVLPQSWTINEDELIWKYRESFYRTCTFLLHTIRRLQYFWSIFTGSPAAPSVWYSRSSSRSHPTCSTPEGPEQHLETEGLTFWEKGM